MLNQANVTWLKFESTRFAFLAISILGPSAFADNPPNRYADMTGRHFVANEGQWSDRIQFRSMNSDTSCCIDCRGISIGPQDAGLAFPNAEPSVRLVFGKKESSHPAIGIDRLNTEYNFLLGNDPSRWATHVATYDSVVLQGVAPGVDVVVHALSSGLEYDIEAEPGAHAEDLVIDCEGARRIYVDESDALCMETADGILRQTLPRCWEVGLRGVETPLRARFDILGKSTYRVVPVGHDLTKRLVLDPGIQWSGYLGGTVAVPNSPIPPNVYSGACAAPNGDAILVGYTSMIDYPVTSGAYKPTIGSAKRNCVITRISADGSSLVFSTFFGGSNYDAGEDVFLAADQTILVTGETVSSDFPVTPGAISMSSNFTFDLFVSKFSVDGSALLASARFGGTQLDAPERVSSNSAGSVLVVGATYSPDYPISAGAVDSTLSPPQSLDAFASVLSPDLGHFVFSTFLGGSANDLARTGRILEDGSAYVAGSTSSSNFPVTPGASQPSLGFFGGDGFLARIAPDGTSLAFSTYFGGPSGGDAISGLDIDGFGNATVVGETLALDFPTTPGVLMPTCPWSGFCDEAFASRFSPSGGLLWSTYFGGGGFEQYANVRVESDGGAILAGETFSDSFSLFPVTPGSIKENYYANCWDSYVARLTSDGRRVEYGTFFGGSGCETNTIGGADTLAVDWSGSATITSYTDSTDFPVTPGAYDTTTNGAKWFVSRLDLLPTGVSKYGTPSVACGRRASMRVTAEPKLGFPDFGIRCISGPVNASGFLALSLGALATPLKTTGIDLWVDPSTLYLIPMTTDSVGASQLSTPLNLPANYAGLTVAAQFLWIDACGAAGLSSSNALAITLQS